MKTVRRQLAVDTVTLTGRQADKQPDKETGRSHASKRAIRGLKSHLGLVTCFSLHWLLLKTGSWPSESLCIMHSNRLQSNKLEVHGQQ